MFVVQSDSFRSSDRTQTCVCVCVLVFVDGKFDSSVAHVRVAKRTLWHSKDGIFWRNGFGNLLFEKSKLMRVTLYSAPTSSYPSHIENWPQCTNEQVKKRAHIQIHKRIIHSFYLGIHTIKST